MLHTHEIPIPSSDGIVADLIISGEAVYDTLIVSGTLRLLPGARLKVGTLRLLPGSRFETPLGARDIIITIADKLLDPKDVEQLGTGIICQGHISLRGAYHEKMFIRLAAEPKKGDNFLSLSEPATDWEVNDVIVISDSRQPYKFVGPGVPWERLEVRKVGSLSSDRKRILLDRPLEYDHPGARDGAGRLDFLPHVINRTVGILIQSENPKGTPGHFWINGTGETIIEGVCCRYLGRTGLGPESLKGRYAGPHLHHRIVPTIEGQPAFIIRGCVSELGNKWGCVIHCSHFGLIENNVFYRVLGAGCVTETGSETGNIIRNNISIGIEGWGIDGAGQNIARGVEGSGFWLAGTQTYTSGNVATNCTASGITCVNLLADVNVLTLPEDQRYPVDRSLSRFHQWPMDLYSIVAENNEAYGCIERGLSVWGGNNYRFTIKDTSVWHAFHRTGAVDIRKMRFGTIDGLKVRLDENAIDLENHSPRGYSAVWYYPPELLINADIQGAFENRTHCSSGERGDGPTFDPNQIRIFNCTFGGVLPLMVEADRHYSKMPGEATGSGRTIFHNCKYIQLSHIGGVGKNVYTFWGPETADVGARTPLLIFHEKHQGREEPEFTFEQFWKEQAPEFEMLYDNSSPMALLNNAPEPGKTNQYIFDHYGFSTGGRVPPPTADTTSHPDIEGFTAPIDLKRATPFTTRKRTLDVHAALWGTADYIEGWVQDRIFVNDHIEIGVYDGDRRIATTLANGFSEYIYDSGLGRGYNGFMLPLPITVKDAKEHTITIRPTQEGAYIVESPGRLLNSGIIVKSDIDQTASEEIMATIEQLTATISNIRSLKTQTDNLEATRTHLEDHLISICATHVDPEVLQPLYDSLIQMETEEKDRHESYQNRITLLKQTLADHGVHDEIGLDSKAESDII